uniref:RNA 2',3'-cyclic phosphodiesterase n=1 Tax=Fervidicoccus fontis TaxID=683846 RepID=A0A7J3ZIU9_9CREN
MRLFVAIDIESPQLIAAIRALKDVVQATGVPQKPVEDENLHLTLAFIGEVEDDDVERIREALKKIEHNVFNIHLKGLGAFPTVNRPRVVWIGVEEGRESLHELHSKVAKALSTARVNLRDSRFEPHLTITRIKGSKNLSNLVRVLTSYEDYDVGWLTVSEFKLKQSILTPKGPIYKTLLSVPLKA